MTTVQGGTLPLWWRNKHRWVDRRSGVLSSRHDVRESVAETLAWSELGYSSSGIAKRADTTRATVRAHFDVAGEAIDEAALLAKRANQVGIDAPAVPGGETA